MEQLELEAVKREKTGTSTSNRSRKTGVVPAIIYVKGSASTAIEIDSKKFFNILTSKAGKNALINIKLAGESKVIPVLTHDIQINPINDTIIHVDFFMVNMQEAVKTKVPIYLHGESIGVKLDGGILVHGLREVEIKCLPTDIPNKYEIDVTSLKIGNSFHVSDLKVEKGVTVLTLPTEIIVAISAPSKEEVEVAPITAPEVTGQTVPVPGAAGAAPAAAAAPAQGKEAAPAKGAVPAKGAAPAKDAAPAKAVPAQPKK